MKKCLIYAAILFLVAACQKENLQTPANQKEQASLEGNTYKLNFSSSGFTSSLIPMAKMARPSIMNVIDDTVKKMNFFIYDDKNNLVGNFAQTSLDEDFGNLTVDLQEGTYKIGAVGYSGSGYIDNNFRSIYYSPNFDYDPPKSDNKETFVYGYKNIEVNSDSTYAPFELKRLTSLLEIVILDKIPEEAKELRATFVENGLINLFTEDTVSYPIEEIGHYFDLTPYHNQDSTKLQCVIVPFLKSGAPMELTVKVYSTSGQLLKEYSFDNLNFKSNYITRLTGKIFNNSTEGGNVSVSTSIIKDYDGEIDEEF